MLQEADDYRAGMEARLVAARSPATTFANGRFTWEGLWLKALSRCDQGWPDDKVCLHLSLHLITLYVNRKHPVWLQLAAYRWLHSISMPGCHGTCLLRQDSTTAPDICA